jgi:hypothetical protein
MVALNRVTIPSVDGRKVSVTMAIFIRAGSLFYFQVT